MEAGTHRPRRAFYQHNRGERQVHGGRGCNGITGTWNFATMQGAFGQDYGLFTAPSPAAGPRWSLGEDQSQSIPYNSRDPDTAAAVLDFCIRRTGAQVFAKHGNLMATSAALPYEVAQIKVVPVKSPNIGVYLYGWLPLESQNAWMNGFTSVLQGKVTPKAGRPNPDRMGAGPRKRKFACAKRAPSHSGTNGSRDVSFGRAIVWWRSGIAVLAATACTRPEDQRSPRITGRLSGMARGAGWSGDPGRTYT